MFSTDICEQYRNSVTEHLDTVVEEDHTIRVRPEGKSCLSFSFNVEVTVKGTKIKKDKGVKLRDTLEKKYKKFGFRKSDVHAIFEYEQRIFKVFGASMKNLDSVWVIAKRDNLFYRMPTALVKILIDEHNK